MNKRLNLITGSVLMLFTVGLIGCGQGFESHGKSAGGVQAASIDNEMAKAEEANQAALTAMAEANLALKDITDSKGNINLNLFKKSTSTAAQVETQGLLTGVIDRLRVTFDTLFAKVTTVKAKFSEARKLLADALAKIDQSNPANAAMVQQIMSQMAKVDAMERQFSASMHSLASKLDLAISGLDKLVSGVTSFIPGFGWIASLALDYLVMGDIKNFIYEIKMRLMAL